MRKAIVHDKDEAFLLVSGRSLPDGRVVEAGVASFAEILLGNYPRCATLGHVGRMGSYGQLLEATKTY
jgi:tRNA A58 N-methylase Trm61